MNRHTTFILVLQPKHTIETLAEAARVVNEHFQLDASRIEVENLVVDTQALTVDLFKTLQHHREDNQDELNHDLALELEGVKGVEAVVLVIEDLYNKDPVKFKATTKISSGSFVGIRHRYVSAIQERADKTLAAEPDVIFEI